MKNLLNKLSLPIHVIFFGSVIANIYFNALWLAVVADISFLFVGYFFYQRENLKLTFRTAKIIRLLRLQFLLYGILMLSFLIYLQARYFQIDTFITKHNTAYFICQLILIISSLAFATIRKSNENDLLYADKLKKREEKINAQLVHHNKKKKKKSTR